MQIYGYDNATAPYGLTIEAPTDIPADDLEPNDNFASATDLQVIFGTVDLSGLTIHENADGSDNVDFYRFETTEVGTSATTRRSNSPIRLATSIWLCMTAPEFPGRLDQRVGR